MKYSKQNEFVVVNGNDISFSVDVANPKNVDDYFLTIPSLKIHSSAKTLEGIQTEFKASIDSFINYWLKIKGEYEFVNHLKNLGFAPNSTAGASYTRDLYMHAGEVSDVELPKFSSARRKESEQDELTTFTYETTI